MPIKSKVFIQTLQKSQDRHKISFAFGFNNKNIKKVFGANLSPPPKASDQSKQAGGGNCPGIDNGSAVGETPGGRAAEVASTV